MTDTLGGVARDFPQMRDDKILTGPTDHCRNNYDALGRLLLRCRDKPRRPPRPRALHRLLAGAFPDPPGISWKFPAVSRKRTRTCFVGGEIQLWKIQLFAFKQGFLHPDFSSTAHQTIGAFLKKTRTFSRT
ncbi:hypothetical protein [Achromobacter sp. Marseille-Q4954]|uniref:hypothetical protein n=1 Tax=Achromobacter sp. Marseille-Q4954 TaxID=2942203 RepID=UPI0020748DF0|nr:hypothetical protein [Achromobacter sp. Marseille-Q4954]